MLLLSILALLLGLWLFAEKKFRPKDHSRYDKPIGELFSDHEDDSLAIENMLQGLKEVDQRAQKAGSLKKRLAVAREFADSLSDNLESDCEFKAVIANGVPCEWAVAPGVDPKRRLLFFHGGAFILGSPKGHRIFAHNLSHLAKAAVLSVDYRMLPENKRMAGIDDARSAYHYILTQGPDGDTPLDKLAVAGDSAGGNIALMISHWSRKHATRSPDAVVGVAPSLDSTLSSPSIKDNAPTDKVLGKFMGMLSKIPKPIFLWFNAIALRANPADPALSPLLDDLEGIPPTLLQASNSECLLGDSIRYANKAKEAGADITLQIWENQPHDPHIFTPDSGSGREMWSKIGEFLSEKMA